MLRHDYIKRLIEQLGAAIARIAGLVRKQDFETAETELMRAYQGLGINPSLLLLDARSIARLLPEPERLEAVARLSEAEADLYEAQGDAAGAKRCRERAGELLALIG